MFRQLWAKALQFILVNCAIFAAYRVGFVKTFGGPDAWAGLSAALVTGFGLDAALLALELSILVLLALVTRGLHAAQRPERALQDSQR
jgi:hypothetical protein